MEIQNTGEVFARPGLKLSKDPKDGMATLENKPNAEKDEKIKKPKIKWTRDR